MAAPPALSAQPVRDAASYPSKPVRWVVGFTAGASNDVIARTVGAPLSEAWGQQFIIDNRPGATGMIAGEIVARAVPDGYTLLLATGGPNTIAPLLSRKSAYRVEDFDYVSVVAYTPLIIVVTPSLAAKTPRELVEYLTRMLHKQSDLKSLALCGIDFTAFQNDKRSLPCPLSRKAAAGLSGDWEGWVAYSRLTGRVQVTARTAILLAWAQTNAPSRFATTV